MRSVTRESMRPIRATMDLAAVRANLGVIRARAPASRVWAVCKANAYGHGLERLAPALAGADGLALLELDAAIMLRERGNAQPMLMLEGFFAEQELAVYSRLGIATVVHHDEQLRMLKAARLDRPLAVHLKFNSGMNRLGFDAAGLRRAFEALSGHANVAALTLMTHFADADGAPGVVDAHARFERATAGMPLPATLANSAAILRYPQTHRDWVRPGILLYGCSPLADTPAQDLGLRPVMTLRSRIIAVRTLAAGDRVGYGGTYTADLAMRVGVVACGYADGYPRHAPGTPDRGTPVLVAGRRTRTVGRVSMDMLIVDLSDLPEAGIGSEVVLWGEGLSADEVASAAGTVSYELLCALAPRVPVDVVGAMAEKES